MIGPVVTDKQKERNSAISEFAFKINLWSWLMMIFVILLMFDVSQYSIMVSIVYAVMCVSNILLMIFWYGHTKPFRKYYMFNTYKAKIGYSNYSDILEFLKEKNFITKMSLDDNSISILFLHKSEFAQFRLMFSDKEI